VLTPHSHQQHQNPHSHNLLLKTLDPSLTRQVANNTALLPQPQSAAFPLPGPDAAKHYQQYLTPFERDEVRQYELVYYMNLTANRKAQILNNPSGAPYQTITSEGSGAQGKTAQFEGLGEQFNNGFDTEDGDYLGIEMGDQINYRYEVVKKLGRGAFGVVVRCVDHKLLAEGVADGAEQVALKILKNKKKLHKQGKIEIKILEMLRDDDPEEKRNVVKVLDSFTFRNHVVSTILSFELF
jgi:hypothetical protein